MIISSVIENKAAKLIVVIIEGLMMLMANKNNRVTA
jgi:hypothetical protein